MFASFVDIGGILGVLVHDQILPVIKADFVFNKITEEGGELDGAAHAAVGEEQLLRTS